MTLFPLYTLRKSELERAAYMAGRNLLAELVDSDDANEARIEQLEDKADDDAKTIFNLNATIAALASQQEAMRREADDAIKSCRDLLSNLESRIAAINNLPA